MGKRKHFSLSVGGKVRFKGNWILQNTEGLLRHKQSHKDFESAKQDSICGTMTRQCHKIDLFEIARGSE